MASREDRDRRRGTSPETVKIQALPRDRQCIEVTTYTHSHEPTLRVLAADRPHDTAPKRPAHAPARTPRPGAARAFVCGVDPGRGMPSSDGRKAPRTTSRAPW